MSVTITGGTGFLGKHLVKKLIEKERVLVLDSKPWPSAKPPSLTEIVGDVRDFSAVLKACTGAEHVYHLAAQLPISRLSEEAVWSINVDGTKNVLEASLRCKVRRVVHISSSSVYGIPSQTPCHEDSPKNPIGMYGRSKIMAERICMQYVKKGLDVVVLRPMTIIGPGMKGVFLILFNWVRDGKRVYLIGNGTNRVQMISLFDLVDASILAAQKPGLAGQIMNVGSDNVPTVRQLIWSLIAHAQSKSGTIPLSPWFAARILMLLHRLDLSPLVAEHYYLANRDFILDTARVKSLLNWKPSLSNIEMMNQAYDWYVQNPDVISAQQQGILRLLKLLS